MAQYQKFEKTIDSYVDKVHGEFINETDFDSEQDYVNFFDLYIKLKYEPLNEEYENRRFFI